VVRFDQYDEKLAGMFGIVILSKFSEKKVVLFHKVALYIFVPGAEICTLVAQ